MSNTNYLSSVASTLACNISFTVMSSNHGPLTKIIDLVDGKIIKTPAANLWEGTAIKCSASFEEFKAILTNGDPNYALSYGVHSDRYDPQVSIVTKGKEEPSNNVLARTADYYLYSQEPGILMIDHDPSQYGPSVTASVLLDILAEVIPGFDEVAYIVKPSTSAGIYRVGEAANTSDGFHLYIPVLCAADIPRFGRDLFDRLWLAEWGYIALAKNGALLTRTLIDGAVFCPERLDFIANPIINSSELIYCPPELMTRDGGLLDTTRLQTLTDAEKNAVKHRIDAAKQNINARAATVKEQWMQNKVTELISSGIPAQQAQDTVNDFASHGFKKLFGDFVLEFADATLGKV